MCGRVGAIPAAVMCLAGFGCSADALVKVEGAVTLDGEPVEGAMVTFIPEDGNGRPAHGQTDKHGVFHLTTQKPRDGAWRGNYKVVVDYKEGVTIPPATNMRDAFQGLKKAEAEKTKPPRYVIPAQFSDPGKTVLRKTVPPPEGRIILALTSK
jgi:hypothetical protein